MTARTHPDTLPMRFPGILWRSYDKVMREQDEEEII